MDTDAIEPILQACAAEPKLCTEASHDVREILRVVRDLGGDRNRYAREWRRASKAIVSEVFSPPRVTEVLRTMRKTLPNSELLPGVALDLTTHDGQGRAWDFDKYEMRQEARRLIKEQKPYVLIGSPQCTPYSSLQAMNETKRDPLKVRRERARVDLHLQFVMELYREQMAEGRDFLHEHPAWATSWKTDIVKEISDLV